jgi:rfaE bifunctional protein kinase chain/domain
MASVSEADSGSIRKQVTTIAHAPMTGERLREILKRTEKLSVGIIGDFCLDAYWELEPGNPELSVETGKPTHAVTAHRYSPGGAGNIAVNVASLGVSSIETFGVIGNDLFGRELRDQLVSKRIAVDGLLVQEEEFNTPVYAKPYIGKEEQERIDFGRHNIIGNGSEANVTGHLRQRLSHLDALIINQQLLNGICSERMLATLNDLALEFPTVVMIADSRHRSEYLHNTIRKLNTVEALQSSSHSEGGDIGKRLRLRALEICKGTKHPVFITRGHDGMLACNGEETFEIPAVKLQGEIDPVGAGDTTVAAVACALASGATVCEAAEVGNLAAAVTVQKLRQTGAATPNEIIATFLQQP